MTALSHVPPDALLSPSSFSRYPTPLLENPKPLGQFAGSDWWGTGRGFHLKWVGVGGLLKLQTGPSPPREMWEPRLGPPAGFRPGWLEGAPRAGMGAG